jgi:CRP-like cAMP-binding protein
MSGKVVLTGGLKFTSLADLFQIIGGNNSTGTLRINSQYTPDPGIIYFVEGNPVNASDGHLRGLDAIYALFGRTEGNFEFIDGRVSVEHAIKKSRMEIVLDALRMIDDGVIKKVEPPSTQEILIGRPDKPEEDKKTGPSVIKGPAIDYLYIVDEEDFYDGKTIVKEGTHGKWIWIVLEGKVKIIKETRRGPLTILHLGEGCYIGTFSSLLFHDYARSASVKAVGDVRLGLLDTQRLANEYYTLPMEFRGMLASLDRRLKKITDRAADLALKKTGLSLPSKGLEVVVQSGSKKEGCLRHRGRKGLCDKKDPERAPPPPGTGRGRFLRFPTLHGYGPRTTIRLCGRLKRPERPEAQYRRTPGRAQRTFHGIQRHDFQCLHVYFLHHEIGFLLQPKKMTLAIHVTGKADEDLFGPALAHIVHVQDDRIEKGIVMPPFG